MKKKNLKTLFAGSLAVAMLLTGCGGGDVNNGSTSSTASQPSNTAAPAPSTPSGPTAEPTAAPTLAPANDLVYAPGTELRMATGYSGEDTGITFVASIAGEGITLADGKTYHTGDLKPTWVALEEKLNVKFKNVWTGQGDSKEFEYWKQQLDQVDMVAGTASQLAAAGEAGQIVDLNKYIDKMPNFKAYLESNPLVRLSITGSLSGDSKGAIYFSPYFDGVDDIERMDLMRVDWVQKLLDGEGEFKADASNMTAAPVYQPYMPTSGKVEIDVVTKDGSKVEKINKDYDKAGNIVKLMNDKGSMSGVEAVNMLRKYIDEAYNNYYGTTRSDLFCGQNAAWDADELVALLRCVVANPQTLNGTDKVQGIFTREENKNSRRAGLFQMMGSLFGVRGMDSRNGYLYIDSNNKMHDARQEKETYVALERMYALTQEGLISESFLNGEAVKTENYLEKDLAFMHHDYNQTQTVYNKTKLDEGEKYMAVMVPVARWNDGTGEVYMRFTESWRSVKSGGWGISKLGVGNDENRLNALLALIDYAYSYEGQILMSYGPDAFIKTKADGSYETFSFNGVEMPVIADATYQELWDKASGNYTNYARKYLGSTLSFMKSQAFEYQCTHEVGKEGMKSISNAIALGTIKHPLLTIADNGWWTSVPTILPHTETENNMLAELTDLGNTNFSGEGKLATHLFLDIIAKGFTGEGTSSIDETVKTVSETWKGKQYLALQEQAWQKLYKYYKGQ